MFVICMEIENFGKMMRNLIKMIKKNFIDIKFISISLIVLIFVSLFVFKPVGLLTEGMENGESYIAGEAPKIETVKENENENETENKEVKETDMIDSCDLCSKECPNNEPSCIESKKFSCVECQKKKTLEEENNDKQQTPIVINVYAGSPGTDNTGDVKASESSNALKNPNVNLSNLVGNTGELEYPPANSNSYMAQDMNNTTINDSVEETVPPKKVNDEPVKTVTVDMEGNGNVVEEVKPDEGVSSFISGMGGYNKVRSGQIIPNASYSLLNDTQMEIDEMNNLQI
jgi:hypothetical protein